MDDGDVQVLRFSTFQGVVPEPGNEQNPTTTILQPETRARTRFNLANRVLKPLIGRNVSQIVRERRQRELRTASEARPRSPTTPMVVMHRTPPPEPTFVGSSYRSPPRRLRSGYKYVYDDTPPSSVERSKSLSPVKSPLVVLPPGLRRSPRKRLVYFTEEEPNDPPTPKKVKFEFSEPKTPHLRTKLHALAEGQLVNIIANIANEYPELLKDIERLIPKPDLKAVEAQLKVLRICIHKSLPKKSKARSRLKTDEVAFARSEPHVFALKSYIFQVGNKFKKSQYWPSVVEFAVMAWNCVSISPNWDRPLHYETKGVCFDYLTRLMQHAVNNGTFSKPELIQIKAEVTRLSPVSEGFPELLSSIRKKISELEL